MEKENAPGPDMVVSNGPGEPAAADGPPARQDLAEKLAALGIGRDIRVADYVRKPDVDDRQYRLLELPNGLEILLVHDAETEKAAAALDVNVGHLADPDEWQGLAHFLEHLLFMGTAKYPQENDYSDFLAKHAGYSNAFTGPEDTNYYFEVSSDFLEPALDRFAQFFISPLFNASGVDREMNAVDSEHKKNLQSDPWRLHQIDCSLSDPGHPWCKFGTGSLETLKREGQDIREALIAFHAKWYSANLMKLVVLGKESLDELTLMTVPLFQTVPNKNLHPLTFSTNPLTTYFLLKRVHARPIKDLRTLELVFPFPDTTSQYRVQPARYLSHLIGHEGAGSLLSYLKTKGWGMGLSAGEGRGAAGFAFFRIHIELTPEGLEKWRDVVLACFSYIAMLRREGVHEWIWQETARLAEISFRFREKKQPSSFASRIAGQMQLYHGDEILSGPYLMHEFDRKAIEECVEALRTDCWRVVLVCRADLPDDGAFEKEKHYGVEYAVADVSDLVKEIDGLAPDPAFFLPIANEFVPDNLSVGDRAEGRRTPRLLLNTDRCMLWHKKDTTFLVPKANVYILFRTPLAYLDPFASAAARMFTELLRDYLNERAYYAEVAGLSYSLEAQVDGIVLSLQGYSDKLHVLLARVLEAIKSLDFCPPDRFSLVREQLERTFANYKLNAPNSHAIYNLTRIVQDVLWMHEEKLAEVQSEGFTPEAMRAFVPRLFERCSVEMLVHGNVDEEGARKLFEEVDTILPGKPLPEAERKKSSRSMVLPDGQSWTLQLDVPNVDNPNSAIEYYVECGDPYDVALRCHVQMLSQIAYEPCFDQLRTKEQLGYLVWSGSRRQAGTVGFRIVVQSEKEPTYLETRIEAFLIQLRTLIAEMSDEDYEKHVQARVLSLLEKDKTLAAESSRFWSHIEGQGRAYEFEQERTDAEFLKSLPKSSLLTFYDEYIMPSPASPKRRKLSVHMRSQLAKPEEGAALPEDTRFIKDVVDFKTSLAMSKGSTPVKPLEEYMA
ncbi:Metalloenzyme, LuxS/M16 peptidase-like protein [Hyaloraphidium curvatum]|nr:Metalloenzyme, LuxS/M16 peptidase-like protein [Hyaloraphidium curvatum]